MFKKKRALCDIAKNFVLFENETSYEDFFYTQVFKTCYGYFVYYFQSKFALKKHRDTKVTFCYSCINMSLQMYFSGKP